MNKEGIWIIYENKLHPRGVHLGWGTMRLWMQAVRDVGGGSQGLVKGEKDSSVHSAFELDSFGSGHGTMKICVERLDTLPSGHEFSLNEDCVNVYIAWQCFVW